MGFNTHTRRIASFVLVGLILTFSRCVVGGLFKNRDGTRKRLHQYFGNSAEIEKRPIRETTLYERRQRAGYPHCYSRWARCPDDSKYGGYYLGGGAAWKNEGRDYYHEGTWGWDYAPAYSRVRLRWFHGRRQAGTGQYESDRKNNPLRDLYRP